MYEVGLMYLIAIGEGIRYTMDIVGKWAVAVGLIYYCIFKITYWITISNTSNNKYAEEHAIKEPKILNRFYYSLAIGCLCWTIGALFPTPENILKAYAIIEGSKIINAENTEKVAEAVGARFDKFMDIIDRSINGKMVEKPKEAPVEKPKEETKPAVPHVPQTL